jgi:predicted NBD/HSP70 family sugar kinase
MNDNFSNQNSRGSNQSGVRAYNERLVLSLLRRYGAHAKASIAQMTGLSAQTVSVIMRELEKDGLLKRGERVRGKVGQPSVPMSLSAEGAYFYGLKLGRRSSDLVLIDFLGNILFKIHQTYPFPVPENIVAFTRNSIEKISFQLTDYQKSRIAGLGIGMPFHLWNWVESVGAPQEVMDDWRTCDIRQDISSIYSFPVYLQNDATAACGAELVFGQSARLNNFAYFYIGYFIGGGVVLNGVLYPGPSGNAGAMGPMPVPHEDGRSHQLIDVASIWVLERKLLEARADASSLWESADNWNVDVKILEDWIDSSARGIAHAIISIESIIDFETIIVDGWLPLKVRQSLVESICHHADKMDFTGLEMPQIIEGSVGQNARALGAASLPLSLRFMVDQCSFLK